MSAARRGRSGDRRWIAGVALAALLSTLLPAAAHSSWSYSPPPLTASLRTAQIPTPASFSCRPSGGLLGIGSTADFSWAALPTGTAWRYQVWIRDPGAGTDVPVSAAGQTGTSISIGTGLLTGLLGSILDLLLGGGQAYVRVVAVHPSGWTSAATPEIPIRRASLLGGVTC